MLRQLRRRAVVRKPHAFSLRFLRQFEIAVGPVTRRVKELSIRHHSYVNLDDLLVRLERLLREYERLAVRNCGPGVESGCSPINEKNETNDVLLHGDTDAACSE
ncbi:hypothetical protein Trydic_g15377 [Trypoxylus dichotomus]